MSDHRSHLDIAASIPIIEPEYDYLIIGAGPAGLQAAGVLSVAGKKVLIVDEGDDVHVAGEIGSGFDYKLSFGPTVRRGLYGLDERAAVDKVICNVEKVYTELSGCKTSKSDSAEKSRLRLKCIQNGMIFVSHDEMHIKSHEMVQAMKNFRKYLEGRGVKFWFNAKAVPVCTNDAIFINYAGIRYDIRTLANKTVIAIGRGTSEFFSSLGYNVIKTKPKPVGIGVRIETLSEIAKPITDHKPDFKIVNKFGEFSVRSHCVNPGGFVTMEGDPPYSIAGVNGRSEPDSKSANCNFAVLFKAELKNSDLDTSAFGKNIAHMFNCLAKDGVIVQRLKDVYDGRRSTPLRISRSNVVPTLKSAVPGNIGWAMPYNFMLGIIDYLKKLDHIMPGIADGYNTLIYGPEIKPQSIDVKIDKNFCANNKHQLYVIGDCSGKSNSIVSAAATGALFARKQLMEDK